MRVSRCLVPAAAAAIAAATAAATASAVAASAAAAAALPPTRRLAAAADAQNRGSTTRALLRLRCQCRRARIVHGRRRLPPQHNLSVVVQRLQHLCRRVLRRGSFAAALPDGGGLGSLDCLFSGGRRGLLGVRSLGTSTRADLRA